jgi:hypothetical protein
MEQTTSTTGTSITKSLPRDENGELKSHFQANGKTYRILSESDMFPISRWGLYSKFTAQYLSGQDFQGMYHTLSGINDTVNGYADRTKVFTDIVLSIKAAMEGLMEMSKVRFDSSLYLSTLFILSDGEDITEWSLADADIKIEDWSKEGYRVDDFFTLAGNMAVLYLKELRRLADLMTAAQV